MIFLFACYMQCIRATPSLSPKMLFFMLCSLAPYKTVVHTLKRKVRGHFIIALSWVICNTAQYYLSSGWDHQFLATDFDYGREVGRADYKLHWLDQAFRIALMLVRSWDFYNAALWGAVAYMWGTHCSQGWHDRCLTWRTEIFSLLYINLHLSSPIAMLLQPKVWGGRWS